MEIEKVEEFEQVEIVCSTCIGNMIPVQIQTPRLFRVAFYRKLMLLCNVCNKTSKPYTEKIKQ